MEKYLLYNNQVIEVNKSVHNRRYIKQSIKIHDTKTGDSNIGLAGYGLERQFVNLIMMASDTGIPVDLELVFKFAQNDNFRTLNIPILPCSAVDKMLNKSVVFANEPQLRSAVFKFQRLTSETEFVSKSNKLTTYFPHVIRDQTITYMEYIKANLLETYNRIYCKIQDHPDYISEQDKKTLTFIRSLNFMNDIDFNSIPLDRFSREKIDVESQPMMDDIELQRKKIDKVVNLAFEYYKLKEPFMKVIYINSTPCVFTTPTGTQDEYILQMLDRFRAVDYVTRDAQQIYGGYKDSNLHTPEPGSEKENQN